MSLGATLGQQAPGTYTQDQILSDAVKTSYGLGTDATPNDVFGKLVNAVLGSTDETAGGQVVNYSRIYNANYTGNGNTILPFVVVNWKILFIIDFSAKSASILIPRSASSGMGMIMPGGNNRALTFNILASKSIQVNDDAAYYLNRNQNAYGYVAFV